MQKQFVFHPFYQNNMHQIHFTNQINPNTIHPNQYIPTNCYSYPSSPILQNFGIQANQNNDNNNFNEKFSISICSFVSNAEMQYGSLFTFTDICNTYHIQRRRLYDVINALEAIGCCKKTSVDTIFWEGLRFIPEKIKIYFSLFKFENSNVNLDILISKESCISILQLTQSFILLFIVLQKQILDIKKIAVFLSRKNNRFKTTDHIDKPYFI